MDLFVVRDTLAPSSAPVLLLPLISTPCSHAFATWPRSSRTSAQRRTYVSFSPICNSLRGGDAVGATLRTLRSSFNEVDCLEKVEVLDLSGNKVQLTTLWRDRTAVIGFARHFGCILCRKRADILASRKNEMDAARVALVLIGPGTVDQASTFMRQTNFPGEVYADPSHAAYEALELVSGLSTTFTPKGALNLVTAYIEGYRQDWALSFEKDTVRRGGGQQGGVLVAGPGVDRIIYLHKDKEAGDEPDIQEVLSACCKS